MPHVATAPESEPVQNVDTHMDTGLPLDGDSPPAKQVVLSKPLSPCAQLDAGVNCRGWALRPTVHNAELLLRCRKGCSATSTRLCWAVTEP